MNEQVREQQTSGSSLSLWIAIALLFAGVVGYYVLEGQSLWLRWGSVVAGLVVGALVFGLSAGGRDFRQFMLDARNELRKVFWPTKNETWITTLAVFIFAIVAGLGFWLLDLFLAWATKLLTGQGG
ncbi:MAG TPA: preprotein translocase subunit SecE [Flavobacteriales bacterium]|jgi:preprotein translocase subunit SecE|nr:preprotein translocase subunit SecE [Flavobacteriales bacterium]